MIAEGQTTVRPSSHLLSLYKGDHSIGYRSNILLATLAIFPNGRPLDAHFAFITINLDWSFDEMTQTLVRAASESDGNPTEGYSVLKALKVGTGPMWREAGFQYKNPVVEEGSFRDLLKMLKANPGRYVLIADMEGEEVDRWGGLSAEMMG